MVNEKSLYIYVDGSFSKGAGLGVAGFMIFLNRSDHESETYSSARLQTFAVEEINNIRVELRSALLALNYVSDNLLHDNDPHQTNQNIYLYTDCSTTHNLPGRQKKLVASQFTSKRTGAPLHNADLYRQFFPLHAKTLPTIVWIKGHRPKQKRNFIERNFSFLDRLVREKLRHLLSCQERH